MISLALWLVQLQSLDLQVAAVETCSDDLHAPPNGFPSFPPALISEKAWTIGRRIEPQITTVHRNCSY